MWVENDDDIFSDGAQQIVKAHSLLGIETSGRFVNDDEAGIAEKGLRDAEALLHAAGKAAQRLISMFIQVGLLEQRAHHFAAFLRVLNPLKRREMREQHLG